MSNCSAVFRSATQARNAIRQLKAAYPSRRYEIVRLGANPTRAGSGLYSVREIKRDLTNGDYYYCQDGE